MSTPVKAFIVVTLGVLIASSFMPQMAAAHSMDRGAAHRTTALVASSGTGSGLSAPGRNAFSAAAGFINPALGSALSSMSRDNCAAGGTATSGTLSGAMQSSGQAWEQGAAGAPYTPMDIDALMAAAPPPATHGLLLVTRKNSWTTHPANHDELVQCVEQDSYPEVGWSGAGVVNGIYQDENVYGEDDNYTSRYEAFFYADVAGTWHFATSSSDASEIEVDGTVVASWYGEHGASGLYSHEGSIALSAGWHNLVYRQEEGNGTQAAHAAFRKPGSMSWTVLGYPALTLKPVNLEEGLLLETRKNSWGWGVYALNHDDLVECVDQDSTADSAWFGAGIVTEVYQDGNIYGNDYDYTSRYEAFFYADEAGTWHFAMHNIDVCDMEIDGTVVAAKYEVGHPFFDTWDYTGGIELAQGWHHLIYRLAEAGKWGSSDPDILVARAAFKRPSDTDWQPLHISKLTLKGVCRMGVDGDTLPDSVEAVLGTDPENSDSDGDLLDDYCEVRQYGTNPLEPDSNNDGLGDYYEVTDVPLDIDDDGIANAWDDDNDNDGVKDGLDMAPFTRSEVSDSFQLDIKTGGDPTYIDFQVRPGDVSHLDLNTQTWDWPSYRETAITLLAAVEDRDEILVFTDLLDLDVSDLTDRFAAANPPAGSVPF